MTGNVARVFVTGQEGAAALRPARRLGFGSPDPRRRDRRPHDGRARRAWAAAEPRVAVPPGPPGAACGGGGGGGAGGPRPAGADRPPAEGGPPAGAMYKHGGRRPPADGAAPQPENGGRRWPGTWYS